MTTPSCRVLTNALSIMRLPHSCRKILKNISPTTAQDANTSVHIARRRGKIRRATTHLETCPKVEVPCSNLRCRDKFPRCEIITHQSMCEYEPVSCKYAKVGCETTPLRINLSKHENNDKLHLRVTVEKVLELTSFVSKSTIRSIIVPRTIKLTETQECQRCILQSFILHFLHWLQDVLES